MAVITLLFFPSSLVARRHVHNSVRIDVERYLDLRDPSWGRRNADLRESRQKYNF